MSVCRATKASGDPCTLPANGSGGLCWAHSPENADKRRRAASKAARAKGNREVITLKEEIKTVISNVKSGDLDRNDAAVMIQGYRALKDFIELERRVREQLALIARLEQVEEGLKQDQGGSRWGT
jgi:hypothetical protein